MSFRSPTFYPPNRLHSSLKNVVGRLQRQSESLTICAYMASVSRQTDGKPEPHRGSSLAAHIVQGLDGTVDIARDDWCLDDENDQSLARFHQTTRGLRDGLWRRFVRGDRKGRLWNDGTGVEATGRVAREAVQQLFP